MNFVPPSTEIEAYNCPRCGVYSNQSHYLLKKHENNYIFLDSYIPQKRKRRYVDPNSNNLYANMKSSDDVIEVEGNLDAEESYWGKDWNLIISLCHYCKRYTVWENTKMIFPIKSNLPPAHVDMPEDVLKIYDEASKVFIYSPRAAAALLRLSIEKLIPQLEGYDIKKDRLNNMIASLVQQGIPDHVQKGLDIIRLMGNHGIHPGEIDLSEDTETVYFLFDLVNLMVEELITRERKIASFYNRIPESKRKQIQKRDSRY